MAGFFFLSDKASHEASHALAAAALLPKQSTGRRSQSKGGKIIDVVPLQYRETFTCSPTEARRARKAIAAFARGWLKGVDATDFESAVGEALANAISHGNCRCLNVTCDFVGQRVVAEIEQQDGAPFQPPSVSTRPAAGSIGGYGLFIMRSVLDALEYAENGRRVRLEKRIAIA